MSLTAPPTKPTYTGDRAAYSAAMRAYVMDWLGDVFYDDLVAFEAQVNQIAPSVTASLAGVKNYLGTYNAGTLYAIGDGVSDGTSIWIKKTTAAAGTTPVTGANWDGIPLNPIPTMSGNSGLFLTNNGTAAAWGAAKAPWTEIGTVAASGSSNVVFSNIPQTYSDLLLVLDEVSHSAAGSSNFTLRVGDGTTDSSAATMFAVASQFSFLRGSLVIPAYTLGKGCITGAINSGSTSPDIATSSAVNLSYWCTGGVKTLRVGSSGGAFDAGNIKLYGRG